LPHLVQTAEQHSGDGLMVLGVTDSSVDDTLQFLEDESLPFAILADAGAVREAWQVGVIWGSPSYLLDEGGQIVAEEVLSLSGEDFTKLLRK
jgi:peroxiredoxin